MRGTLVLCLVCSVLAAGCADDGSTPDAVVADAGADVQADLPPPDLGPDSPPPLPCTIHHDCLQGSYCYYKTCVTDPDFPVYHCNKKDSSGTDTCPPGHTCVDKAGKLSICAESSTYACKDACDCGPAHCCKDVTGTKRCVKDTNDPWLPGGTAVGGATCVQGTNATYCYSAPTCHEGRQAYSDPNLQGKFRAFDRKTNSATPLCGGRRCFGSAINCKTGESCIDTAQATPLPGKACLLLSGGTCVSNALAESVFGYKPSDLLPRCSSTCPKGKPCDAGWVSDRKWAYKRIIGTCGSCGNGTCDPGEWYETCKADCLCGNDICESGENKTCFQDCATCGDGICDPGEMTTAPGGYGLTAMGMCSDCSCGNGSCDKGEFTASTSNLLSACTQDCTCGDGVCAPDEDCPQDCVCADSLVYTERGRICGDGVCDRQGCEDLETCLSCKADCGACAWELSERWGGAALPPFYADAAWGGLGSGGIVVVGSTNLMLGAALQYNGTWSSHTIPWLLGLTSVWGTSTTDLFATSGNNGIYHYNGEIWRRTAIPAGVSNCRRVWGRSSKEVYAVCDGDLLLYDGNSALQWKTLMKTPVGDMWGPPPPSDELYIVSSGFHRCKTSSKTCTKMKTATAPKSTTAISGVQSGSKLDLFAVGSGMSVDVAWHYDGNAQDTWTAMVMPTSTPFWFIHDVWARAANDVHAVDGVGRLLHYDGNAAKTWTELTSPISGGLKEVWGDATDVFALDGPTGTLLRYGGKQKGWTVLSSPEGVTSQRFSPLADVWGASPSDVFAIWGSTVVRHDGKSFKPMSVPTTTPLFGISGGSSSDLLAVGGPWVDVKYLPKPATVLRYDGKTWSQQAGPPSGPLLDVQHSGKSYHAVGAGGGQIWRFDGPAYTPVATVPTAEWLAGISSCSGTKLAVVGAHTATTPHGVVALYDTATKNLLTATIPGVSHLLDVWCDAGVIIAVGGLVEKEWLMYQKVTPKVVSCTVGSGLSCKVEPLPLRARYHNEKGGLHGIWGSSKSDLYAVGQEGALLHYDGTKWEHLAADIRSAGHNWGCEDLLGIWGSKSDLFVSTRSGAIRLGRLP